MNLPISGDFPYAGTLALAGSGEYLPPMRLVDESLLSCLSVPARVVCLPTAAGTEGIGRLDYWMKLGEEHFRSLGVEAVESLPVFTREDAQNPDLAEKVRSANFVYISGGKPYYLLDCLKDTRVLASILEVLASGGVVAGCSAGAMIFGGRIPERSILGGTRPGLNLLPGYFIIPHFDEVPFILRFAAPHMTGSHDVIGIEANTVLACTSSSFRVLGTGGVTISSGRENKRYMSLVTL